jgi:hypothetical protein
MFSGEIGSLQPRTTYAVARTIGSREMGCTRLHDASIKTQSKQRRLPLIVLGLSVGRCTHLSFRGRRHGGCEPGWCWRLGDRFKQSRSIVGHAIDRGRNFVGFEEIFARRREQRSGDHRVHIGAVARSRRPRAAGSPACGGRWDAAHEAEGKPFSLTCRTYAPKEAARNASGRRRRRWKRSTEGNDSGLFD